MSEKKRTDVKNDVETRLTRLEALMRIVKRHIADVDERVGAMPHHDEMSKIEKTGFASIKMLMGAAVTFALVTVACWVTAATVVVPSDHVAVFGYPEVGYVDSSGNLVVGGAVSSTGAISNNTGKVYCSNLVVKTGGTVSLPTESVASAALPSTISNSAVISNVNMKVYGSNLQVVAGGTVTFPAASVGIAALSGGVATNCTFTFLSATATTGRMWFANGVLTNVVYSGE